MPNAGEAERRVKSEEKSEGADSQNGGHFAGGPAPSDAALAAGAAHRDSRKTNPAPLARRQKRSEKLRLRLTEEELYGLQQLAVKTGINRCRLARKALRELVTGGVDLLDREQMAVMELARQMRSIGVNLNQVARQLNGGDAPGHALAEVVDQLASACSESEFTWRRLVATARARTVPEHGRN
ncbi:plasmid mobilization relaxosome protein MobC [Hydrocarboniphaga sp.]|uniref:plasmid mobilization relaxosome protein MobC n=1 Tax=Hydrocarboniphaga sp. TaxID=2033016 RepID=UPI00261E2356|nr:plasmid mobilization relaxosome protein MobC [Hydrocarboniphaga sp.]